MHDIVIFQGRPIKLLELGADLSIDITRLLDAEITDHVAPVSVPIKLFNKLRIPKVTELYVPRNIEHNIILLTDDNGNCPIYLKEKLISVDYPQRCTSKGIEKNEIFAVQWKNAPENCKNLGCKNHNQKKVSKVLKNGTIDSLYCAPYKKLLELDDKENTAGQFQQLCELAKAGNCTVHWLEAIEFGFMWKATYNGSTQSLRPYLRPFVHSEVKWLEFLEAKPWSNVVCINGSAGIGKSTFLASVANKLKEKYANRLVCFVDLKHFDNLMNKELDGRNKLNILIFFQLLCMYFEIHNIVDGGVFRCLMYSERNEQGPKVELFLDGLENMHASGRMLLVKFLHEQMKENDKCYRVLLSTRSDCKQLVENEFSVIPHIIDSLTLDDIVLYLTKAFMARSNIRDKNLIPRRWTNLAATIVSPLYEVHCSMDISKLLGVPVFLKAFEEYVEKEQITNPFSIPPSKIILVLMEGMTTHYLQKKLEHYPKIYNIISTRDVPQLMKEFVKVSAQSLGNQKITCCFQYFPIGSYDRDGLHEFGLTGFDAENDLVFLHPIFPAYLLSEFFFHVPPTKNNRNLVHFYLYHVLFNNECRHVRTLISNNLLTRSLHPLVAMEWKTTIKEFLIDTYNLSNEKYDNDIVDHGNILQLAIIDQNITLARFVVSSLVDHKVELSRLILQKMRVQINKLVAYTETTRNITSNLSTRSEIKCIELSALDMAVIFSNPSLLHHLYTAVKDDLIERKPDNLFESKYECTAVHLAVINCNLENFNYLSQFRKSSVNICDSIGQLPLHIVFYNKWELYFSFASPKYAGEKFCEVHRQVNISKYFTKSPGSDNLQDLHIPDRCGNRPVLSTSPNFSSQIKLRMKGQQNFITTKTRSETVKIHHYNSAVNYIKIVEKLAGKTLVNFKTQVNSKVPPPLHLACVAGYLPFMDAILDKGAKLNIKNWADRTALFTAVSRGPVHSVHYLLEKGIDTFEMSRGVNGIPLLHRVAMQGRLKMLNFMVTELNIPVDLLDSPKERTALHVACLAGHVFTVKLLISIGANINAKDSEGYTPLHQACLSSNLGLISVLLKNGAELNCLTMNGQSVLHLAASKGSLAIVKYLVNISGETGSVDVNRPSCTGMMALHVACEQRNNLEIVKSLVNNRALVNTEDDLGHSPLYTLVMNHFDKEIAAFLIESKAEVNVRNKAGISLLEAAAHKDLQILTYLNEITNNPTNILKTGNTSSDPSPSSMSQRK